jgi:trk system potassium uptake protein
MGTCLARRLTREGHHVTVIERDPEVLGAADSLLDARLITGNAGDFNCWNQFDAANMDYMIALTTDDALNILCAQIAHRLGIRQKIARIRSVNVWAENAILKAEDLNIDLVIRPYELAAREVVRLLKMQDGNVVIDVGNGELQVVATAIGEESPLANLSLRRLAETYSDLPFRVMCVARGIDTIIPGGNFEIRQGDRVHMIAHKNHTAQLMKLAQVQAGQRDHVLIIGGGHIGTRVAELLQTKYTVSLLEKNEERAEELSNQLHSTECLHGDGSDRETLIQAGLLHMDTVIAATDGNDTNIMTSVMAKHLIQSQGDYRHAEIGKTIALVRREHYVGLAGALGIDIVLSPQVLAANSVLRYIRRGYVLGVAHLHGCDAEMVQLIATPGSPITKQPLHQMKGLAGQILIAGVCTDGKWDIAEGVTQINDGDRVECVCSIDGLAELQRLFFG